MATRGIGSGARRTRQGKPYRVHCLGASAAQRCLALVQEAAECARIAQLEIAGTANNSFDIMAINSASEHLERALVELLCFGPKEMRPRY